MARLWLTVSLPLLLMLALSLAVVRSRPVDTVDVQSFLDAVQTCNEPCFLGIQPRTTTRDEAMQRLRASDWIETINREPYEIHWTWSGRQSPFIDAAAEGEALVGGDGLVQSINVQTVIPLHKFWLKLGVPPEGYVGFSPFSVMHFTRYARLNLGIVTMTPCQSGVTSFSETPATILWGNPWPPSNTTSNYSVKWRWYTGC